MMSLRFAAITTALLLSASFVSLADETITRGSNLAVDTSTDGRLAMDLAGGIWVVPHGGGEADLLIAELSSAHRPRWSPDASSNV